MKAIDPTDRTIKKFFLACATVIEEMLPHLPMGSRYRVLDFGLHINPDKLRLALQEAIDEESDRADVIILGYGLCSQAATGLRARSCPLVIPRVDDCISIFLGSGSAYREQAAKEPGSYYLTKGWIEAGDTPFSEFDALEERFGKEHAQRMMKLMLKNYKRLVLINTGQYELDHYRGYAREIAGRHDLRYEEIEGSTALVEKMIHGPWDEEFLIVEPGGVVELKSFLPGFDSM